MTLSHSIEQSLREAGEWLLGIRQTGNWHDMVYKHQGILNTCEAWRTLAAIHQVVPDVAWPEAWQSEDSDRLMQEIQKHGFVRTPYCPQDRSHESVDAAAFLMLMAALTKGSGNSSQVSRRLTEEACDWLLQCQSESGGWSWGMPKPGRPLYPYFTFMAMQALQSQSGRETLQAIKRSERWLMQIQLADGSFPMYEGSNQPDIPTTAYAILALSESGRTDVEPALSRAVAFLLTTSWNDLTQVGHLKVVEAGQPPQLGVVYENYAVAADVLLALVKARSRRTIASAQLEDRIAFLVSHLLEQKEPGQGWPRHYSTLYVTHTVVEALVAYHLALQQPPKPMKQKTHYNPYIPGFPIQTPHLFFGRETLIRRIRDDMKTRPAVKRDIALIGERRIGKTSLLYQLRARLPRDGHVTFYLDLELMQSTAQFLQTFVTELGQAVFEKAGKSKRKARFTQALHRLDKKLLRELGIELQMPFLKLSRQLPAGDMFQMFLEDVDQLLAHFRKWRPNSRGRVLCLLDEIAYLSQFGDASLTGLLRGLAQRTPDLVFLIAGTPKACRSLTDAASPFHNIFVTLRLGQLGREAATQLITQPVQGRVTYTGEAVEALLRLSRRHPYTLQVLCYHCIRLLPASQTRVNGRLVEQAHQEWELQHDWRDAA